MKVTFIEYPPCSTCKNAKKWLNDHGIEHIDRHIKENNPTADELRVWHQKSGLPLKRFFNTSGLLYKDLHIREKLPHMTEEDMYSLLATDGMLIKRPVVIGDDFILVGYKEFEWSEKILK